MPIRKPSSLSPLPKHSLADEVAARIRDAILYGQFAPGERLQEETLAESMAVSRGPVREALSQLEREGMVIKHRNRGTFVARLSPEDAEEVYSLRLALERLAIVWAIRNAQPEELARMQSVVDQIAELTQREIVQQEVAQIDIAFHELLYKASRHSRLYENWSNLRPQVHILLLSRNIVYADFLREAVPSHQAIVDVIRAKNEQRAVEVIEEHLFGGYKRAITAYPKQELHETGLGLISRVTDDH